MLRRFICCLILCFCGLLSAATPKDVFAVHRGKILAGAIGPFDGYCFAIAVARQNGTDSEAESAARKRAGMMASGRLVSALLRRDNTPPTSAEELRKEIELYVSLRKRRIISGVTVVDERSNGKGYRMVVALPLTEARKVLTLGKSADTPASGKAPAATKTDIADGKGYGLFEEAPDAAPDK